MKKFFSLAITILMAISAFAQSTSPAEIKAETEQKIQQMHNGGWQALPGADPMETQITDAIQHQFEDFPVKVGGYVLPLSIVSEATEAGGTFSAAKSMAQYVAVQNMCKQIKEAEDLLIGAVGGEQDLTDAEIQAVKAKVKMPQTISGYTTCWSLYRKNANGQYEVFIRLRYPLQPIYDEVLKLLSTKDADYVPVDDL